MGQWVKIRNYTKLLPNLFQMWEVACEHTSALIIRLMLATSKKLQTIQDLSGATADRHLCGAPPKAHM